MYSNFIKTIIKQMRILASIILLVSLLGVSCKTTKPTKPLESYNQEDRFEPQASIIRIPINIDLKGLEKTLNEKLSGILYEDNDLNDGDNMKVKATKDGIIKIDAEGMTIKYQLPLDLWIQYDTGFGKVEGTAKLSMDFISNYSIESNWQLKTVSKLEKYEWKEKPRMKLGAFSIPVASIANIIISRSEKMIAENIDAMVAQSFKLDEYIAEAWKLMFEPYELSPEYQTWLLAKPNDIGMTPVVVENGQIKSTIIVESKPELLFGLAPMPSPFKPLPSFAFRYLGDGNNRGFQIYVEATMSYGEAEDLAKKSLVGERFEQGKRYVVVEDVELYGQGNKLVIDLQMSGSYNGSIFLTGIPVFNEKRNRIEIENLDYTLDSKNFLIKSLAWMGKGPIKKMIQENMDFLLDYNLKEAQKQMKETLGGYEVAEGVFLKGSLEDLKLYNAYITTSGFKVAVSLNGEIDIDIAGLNK